MPMPWTCEMNSHSLSNTVLECFGEEEEDRLHS